MYELQWFLKNVELILFHVLFVRTKVHICRFYEAAIFVNVKLWWKRIYSSSCTCILLRRMVEYVNYGFKSTKLSHWKWGASFVILYHNCYCMYNYFGFMCSMEIHEIAYKARTHRFTKCVLCQCECRLLHRYACVGLEITGVS